MNQHSHSCLRFLEKENVEDSIKDTHSLEYNGPDYIQTWIWALAYNFISDPDIFLFNEIKHTGKYPTTFKALKTFHACKTWEGDYTQQGSKIVEKCQVPVICTEKGFFCR